jgi:hypothetical protein
VAELGNELLGRQPYGSSIFSEKPSSDDAGRPSRDVISFQRGKQGFLDLGGVSNVFKREAP